MLNKKKKKVKEKQVLNVQTQTTASITPAVSWTLVEIKIDFTKCL